MTSLKLVLGSWAIASAFIANMGNDEHIMLDMVDRAAYQSMYKRVQLTAVKYNPAASHQCITDATDTLLSKRDVVATNCSRHLVEAFLLRN